MTKAEIIDKIFNETGLQKKDVTNVIEAFMDTVRDSLTNKDNVYLRGFGTFAIKHRAPKTARNILKDTTILVEARDVPSFKPSKSFIDKINE